MNAIRLHGVLTQAHWAAVAEFLQRVANKELVLQENGFAELTEQQKELLKLSQKSGGDDDKDEWQNMVVRERTQHQNGERALCQIPEDADSLFINNLFEEEKKKAERKASSEQNDEIVLRLLRKYCKYSRDALDDDIVNAIDACVESNNKAEQKQEDETAAVVVRRRKLGYCPKEEKLYENFVNAVNEEKNEHVLRWLKDQQTPPVRRHSSIETSSPPKVEETRKSSVTLPITPEHFIRSTIEGRKNSITSTSSCSESEESASGGSIASHWQRIWRKHLGSKSIEKRLKKQREAWARSTRKLSDPGASAELASQP